MCGDYEGVHGDILTEPMIWTPRILSVFASLSSLTRPSVSAVVCVCVCVCEVRGGHSDTSQLHSPLVLALLLAEKGNFPVLYSTPSSFSCSSDLPTHATSCEGEEGVRKGGGRGEGGTCR